MTIARRTLDALLEHPRVYRAWQAPFAERKLRPVLERLRADQAGRVLDVGCGPGTNAAWFSDRAYVGVDLNPRYVRYAARRHPRHTFLHADATDAAGVVEPGFDLVLCNSLLHHLDDAAADRTLAGLARLLSEEGEIHVLDLLLPDRGIARRIALADRGRHARPLEAWRALLSRHYEVVTFRPYDVSAAGTPLWRMVHFAGRRPS